MFNDLINIQLLSVCFIKVKLSLHINEPSRHRHSRHQPTTYCEWRDTQNLMLVETQSHQACWQTLFPIIHTPIKLMYDRFQCPFHYSHITLCLTIGCRMLNTNPNQLNPIVLALVHQSTIKLTTTICSQLHRQPKPTKNVLIQCLPNLTRIFGLHWNKLYPFAKHINSNQNVLISLTSSRQTWQIVQ